ncbi:Ferric enterobactin transport ATP-binding protein FepC [Corynebacterium provencense]|uniref:Ferric enterobactin transport ATP-binding protein FepC n=1 Tax=Corynebacterium provencense TaxID=1737425 RepID=A0A2Z3YR83_9CORY|nr:ABC transporter ATP-binding protein [Corynebacterium provencense]AWT27438.1 Ferric enterobactin transport ATP-binding protein FepC [Corynebacterium provencense]
MTDPRLQTDHVVLSYDKHVISPDLSVQIPAGEFTAIVGPNACGKSTLLRALSRLHRPDAGRVLLDGRQIDTLGTKEVARRVGLLPQSATAPDHMTVRDLVARGRSPHQGLFRQWSAADHAAVQQALKLTHTSELADREVDALSGGQRQRVWLALVLAQDTGTILLDEPTTFLDMTHQLEILELCRTQHLHGNRTVVAVLHDLNQAARYATHLIAMRDGQVRATGTPEEVVTAGLVKDIFGLDVMIIRDPVTDTPMVIPYPPDRAEEP